MPKRQEIAPSAAFGGTRAGNQHTVVVHGRESNLGKDSGDQPNLFWQLLPPSNH